VTKSRAHNCPSLPSPLLSSLFSSLSFSFSNFLFFTHSYFEHVRLLAHWRLVLQARRQ
jgi:hypothetical protein